MKFFQKEIKWLASFSFFALLAQNVNAQSEAAVMQQTELNKVGINKVPGAEESDIVPGTNDNSEEKIVEVGELRYKLSHSGNLTVAEVVERMPGSVGKDAVIPSSIDYDGISYVVTGIADRAFYWSDITSISLPNTIKTVGYEAFNMCNNLTDVFIDDIENWCYISFNERTSNPIQFTHSLTVNGEKLTSLRIPEGVKEILPYAFVCLEVDTLETCSTLQTIHELGLFYSNAKTVILNEGLKRIEDEGLAFTGTSELVMPKSIEYLGENSLRSRELRMLRLPYTNPDAIDIKPLGLEYMLVWNGVYSESADMNIYVPDESLDLYKNHAYLGQFSVLKNSDTRNVKVGYFYATVPSSKNLGTYVAMPYTVFPKPLKNEVYKTTLGFGVYKDDELLAVDEIGAWEFSDWKTCNTSNLGYYLPISQGDGTFKVMLMTKDKGEWTPAIDSENVYVEMNISGKDVTFTPRFKTGSEILLKEFAIEGVKEVGHDMTVKTEVTNKSLYRNSMLFLAVNDTVKAYAFVDVAPDGTFSPRFMSGWYDYIFHPDEPGTYCMTIFDGYGNVLASETMTLETPLVNNLCMSSYSVDNLVGVNFYDDSFCVDVEIRNDSDHPYEGELKYVLKEVWGIEANGDTLFMEYTPYRYQSVSIASNSAEVINIDYKTTLSYGAQYVMDIYYYSAGKEVLLVRVGAYKACRPEDKELSVQKPNAQSSVAEEGAIYDLNGRRVQSMQSGINIINGKKVYVR